MDDKKIANPYSPLIAGRKHGSLSMFEVVKLVISVVIILFLTLFIPFGLLGKGAYLFGASFGIYNYAMKMKGEKNVINCPNCERVLGANTTICPRCEHRLF